MSPAPSAPAQNLEPIEVKTSLSDAGTTWGKKLQITVPAKEVGKAFGIISSDLMSKVALPGFRPGKVPDKVISQRFGDQIRREVLQDLATDRLHEVRDRFPGPDQRAGLTA